VTYRGENAVFSAKDVPVEKIDADLLHIPSFFLLKKLQPDFAKLMGVARQRGIWVSFDTGWDPFGEWSKNPHLFDALGEADIFLPNLNEARAILQSPKTSEWALAKKFLEMGLKAVAIKKGDKGSFIADRTSFARIPPFKVEVVDTTGAGDVFNAAFLLSYLREKNVRLAGRFANAAAAISVTRAGWGNYPKLSEVNAFLRSSGFEPVEL
jgi:ribokinase